MGSAKFQRKNFQSKMAESRFASSDEIVDDQLKLNTKWANERKFNPEQCN